MTVRKIMLAEDDVDDQKLFYDFLSHRPDVQLLPVAENGVELLKALEDEPEEVLPDVIILDQNMPKSNGLQTLLTLKQTNRLAHLPVVIYSTYADEQLKRNSAAAGAIAVMTKPVSKQGYQEMVDAILELL